MTTWHIALVGLAAVAFGLGSAVIPVLNAELYAVATAAAGPAVAVVSVLGVAIGQTAGKVAMLVVVRRGMQSTWLTRRRAERPQRDPLAEPPAWRRVLARWSDALLRQMDRPVVGGFVVLLSSVVGLPPLAAVTVLAGMRSLPIPVFTVAVGIGRAVRFAALAWPVVRLSR